MLDSMTQYEKHAIGRKGQSIARAKLGGEQQTHKAPFDVVDFANRIAYEVKTVSALTAQLPIHITDASLARKRAFIRQYHVRACLVVVVIRDENRVDVYRGTLKKHSSIRHMRRLAQ
jgi:hypothetical protein